jgi:hypothetical protein
MRGYVFMLEAVFAVMILVGFMLYLGHTRALSGPSPDQDFSRVLPQLESSGLLRGYVYSGDLQSLEDAIDTPGRSHSIQVCIPSGICTGQTPLAQEVYISTYLLSGEDSYQPREVKLYVW